MRNVLCAVVAPVILSFAVLVYCAGPVWSDSSAASTVSWKQELNSDKEQIDTQKEEIKSNAGDAVSEEKNLLDQIRQAELAGDKAAAASLKSQLRAEHQANVVEKQEDQKTLQSLQQELKSDRKAAKTGIMDANDDGLVDRTERKTYNKNKHR